MMRLIAKLIPMKRELKGKYMNIPVDPCLLVRDRKADPDEKGTESLSVQDHRSLMIVIAKLIPMKRELKAKLDMVIQRIRDADRKADPDEKGTESSSGTAYTYRIFRESQS